MILSPFPSLPQLRQWLGDLDIYLLDLLLKQPFPAETPVLDAGCGMGRNVTYLMGAGFPVYGMDLAADDITYLQQETRRLMPTAPVNRFRVEAVEQHSFPNDFFGLIISSAVLHFARDAAHFAAMLEAMWRSLRPGGILFVRTASTTGMEAQLTVSGNGWFGLPDGSQRFLVSDEDLLAAATRLQAQWVEPLRTVVVHQQRSMATAVWRKPS